MLGALLFVIQGVRSQTITGRVSSENTGERLEGVSVLIKGTSVGTTTNREGFYKLNVSSLNDTVIYSFIGYKSIIVPINGRPEINITLQVEAITAEEIVISGFQTEKTTRITGAISTISSGKLKQVTNVTSGSPIKALQGRVPGLFIYTSGNPSGDATVRIRGTNTLNNNDPLYVVDGLAVTQNAFQLISPIDIETISIVKDEATAAIYGSRASNGVVVITTKKPKANKVNLVYSSKIGFEKLINRPEMLDTKGRAIAQWRAAVNDGVDPATIPNVNYDWSIGANGEPVLNGIDFPDMIAPGYKVSNTNWLDVITRTGVTQDHSILISQGGQNGGALFSFRYFGNKYIEKFQHFKKYAARINSHYYLTKDHIVEIGENIGFTNSTNDGYRGSLYNNALIVRPILPVFTTDGSFSGPPNGDFSDDANPLRILSENQWDQEKNMYLLGNAYVKIQPVDGLNIKSSFGVNWNHNYLRDIELRYQAGYTSRDINSLREVNGDYLEWNFNTTANYKMNFNKNDFNFLLGFSAVRNNIKSISAERFDFNIQDDLDYFVLDAGSGSQVVNGSASGFTLASYFGKVDYAFEDKYLASATLRVDGSSKFAKGNRYGLFPAISVGWNVFKESFIHENISPISNLKLKASWAQVGNQFISPDARFSIFNASYSSSILHSLPWDQTFTYANYATSYDIAGVGTGILPSGFRRIQSGNPDLKWESTTEKNAGVEFGFLKNVITGEFNYYLRNTKNILVLSPSLGAMGEGADLFFNGASVQTKGWEVFLSYAKHLGQYFSLELTANLGHYSDKITELERSVISAFPGDNKNTIIGHSMNSVFGYVAEGLYQTQSDIENHALQPGAGLGRIKYKDLNGDGKIDSKDRMFLGTTTPNYEYGFSVNASYKGFTLNMFTQGIFGTMSLDGRRLTSNFTGLYAGNNYGPEVLQAWTPENEKSTIPALSLNDVNDEGRLSTYFIRNGSYLKLRQVSFGYTFKNIFETGDLTLFIQGENLLTLKSPSFLGKDPENPSLGMTGANEAKTSAEITSLAPAFPRPAEFVFGITLSF